MSATGLPAAWRSVPAMSGRHADGSLRDTVVFSILDTEWPAVRRNLQSRLDAFA